MRTVYTKVLRCSIFAKSSTIGHDFYDARIFARPPRHGLVIGGCAVVARDPPCIWARDGAFSGRSAASVFARRAPTSPASFPSFCASAAASRALLRQNVGKFELTADAATWTAMAGDSRVVVPLRRLAGAGGAGGASCSLSLSFARARCACPL